MSSDYSKPHLLSSDHKMLDGILEDAGMKNHDDAAHQAVRTRAARFLIEQFREGRASPAVLLERLKSIDFTARTAKSRVNAAVPARKQSGEVQLDGVFAPDDYEKRYERDRTWTVVESASGKPARYGSWIMRGLSLRSADRVLRTLNIQRGAQHAS